MEKRLLLYENCTYSSNLLAGTLAFMLCMLGDVKIPEIFGKEKLVEVTLKTLKKISGVNFSGLAANMQLEMEKIYPAYDYTVLKQEITKGLVMEKKLGIGEINNIDNNPFISVSNKKVIKYLDEQLYIVILNCIYDMLETAKKQLSLSHFHKTIKIGEKTCKALYPDMDINEAMAVLAYDINMWIEYNRLFVLLNLESNDNFLYLKVMI